MLERRRPDLLCTSLIQRRSAEECLALARALRAAAPAGTTIVLGGAGIPPSVAATTVPDTHFLGRLHDLERLGNDRAHPRVRETITRNPETR